MSRLPIPGQDAGKWGAILNDFLRQEHNSDGTLKSDGSLGAKVDAAFLLAYGKGYVNHGSDPSAVRPEGFASVEWVGSVEPENIIDGDTWVEIGTTP
jgi:hypothetical protein